MHWFSSEGPRGAPKGATLNDTLHFLGASACSARE